MANDNAILRFKDLKYYDQKMDEVIEELNQKIESGGYEIDADLSGESENPVQNKIITGELNKKINASELADWAKAEDKPEYTYVEVGADPVGSASAAKTEANKYTDEKIADLVGSAPEILNTIEEVAAAIQENESVVEALEAAIGNKANKDEIPTTLPANGGNADTVNGLTVQTAVPANAKFTDTTYSIASTSADGLMSKADKAKLDSTNIVYGTCSTAAATAAKVVTITGNSNWKLTVGSMVVVKFTNTNTASSCTLNVNDTGAKQVWYNNAVNTSNSNMIFGYANRCITYMYDGTYWVWMGHGIDANSTYTNVALGHGYGTCTTAAATAAKVGTLSGYTLTVGGIVSIKFTNAVPASATLNINSKGAKAIYRRGAAITAGIIEAGDTATFIYNGSQYHLIAIDKGAATASLGGYITTGTQTFAGAKTFNGVVKAAGASAVGTAQVRNILTVPSATTLTTTNVPAGTICFTYDA